MGGQQAKQTNSSSLGVEVHVTPRDGYQVRVAPELEDALLRRNTRNMKNALEEAYHQGKRDAEKVFLLQRYALENELVRNVNQQLAEMQAQQQSTLSTNVQELRAKVFEPPARKFYCSKQETDVMECYKNSKSPLECSASVKALTQCAAATVEGYVKSK